MKAEPEIKPNFYLDQCVLSKMKETAFLEYLQLIRERGCNWLYSNEHFEEINRSDNPRLYLDLLSEIEATRLNTLLDEQWKLTDKANFQFGISVDEQYSNYMDATSEVSFDTELFNPLMAWAVGGDYKDQAAEIPGKIEKIAKELPKFKDHDFQKGMEGVFENENNILKSRTALGLDNNIGNLSPNDAIVKIWDKIQLKYPDRKIDEFFGFTDPFSKEVNPLNVGVISCCSILDFVGYKSEKKCRDLKQVPNVLSDGRHIANGIFCNGICTVDDKLASRAKAIYSYKNISTQVFLFTPPEFKEI
jgi:hypothetical protein